MKNYSNKITLSKNNRGVWIIDPSKGCSAGTKNNSNGCYNDCYAAKAAKRYGIDFNTTVYRDFESINHLHEIRKQIDRIDMPFIRMGSSGDPSENWDHTITIAEKLQAIYQLNLFDNSVKEIVIITKHWNNLNADQLRRIKKLKICINTSISVLDKDSLLKNSLIQYEILKDYCRSILRIVSCKFNINNPIGRRYFKRQNRLFAKYKMIDTVFRPSANNRLITDNIILVEKKKFLKSRSLMSKNNKKAYLGICDRCPDMCGLTLK